MSHNDFVMPSGVWANEHVPGASDYYRWDVSQSKLINGDTGGSWAPARPIIIGGAGAQFTSPGTGFTGGVRTQTGGRLTLGAYDIIQLVPPRPRKILMDLVASNPQLVAAFLGNLVSPSGHNYKYLRDAYFPLSPVGPQAGLVPLDLLPSSPTNPVSSLNIPIPGEYLHHGAGLSRVQLRFRVLSRPAALPTSPMSIAVVSDQGYGPSSPISAYGQFNGLGVSHPWVPSRTNALGDYTRPLHNTTFPQTWFRCTTAGVGSAAEPVWNITPGMLTTDGAAVWTCIGPTGFGISNADTPRSGGTVDQYWNDGTPQSLVSTFDPASSPIDRASRFYYISLQGVPVDGSILFHSVRFEFDNITQMYWP